MASWLRQTLKRLVPRHARESLATIQSVPRRFRRIERQVAMLAADHARRTYPGLRAPGALPATPLVDHEFQVCSQQGEDGILLHLLSAAGVSACRFIEFGVGDGRECNTALLSVHFGWSGLLMEGNPDLAARAKAYYARVLGHRAAAVSVACEMVSAENIDTLIERHLGQGEIDLLSIDIDGNDFWVWQAVSTVQPRVVVIEYNAVFGPARNAVVPYQPDFSRFVAHPSGLYYGASLCALAGLGARKGYHLVGCDQHGINAFFVRDGLGGPTAVTPEAAYRPNDDAVLGLVTESRFPEIRHLPLQEG